MLELKNICSERNDRVLYRQLNMTVKSGALVHLRGPNGSGKTSLLRIISGLLNPTEGEVLWCGQTIVRNDDFKSQMLYIGHSNGVKGQLTPIENLSFMSLLKNNSCDPQDVETALAQWGLTHCHQQLAGSLSAGQQRKIALAQLSLSMQSVWLLDEPFTALDDASQSTLTQLLVEHQQRNGIVLFTSHRDVPIPTVEEFNVGDACHA